MSGNSNNVQIQCFEWGTVQWLYEPKDVDIERLSVAIITFYSNSRYEEHSHAGDEQVIYVVSGHGTHTINGVQVSLNPGDIIHIPPYARHEVVNTSNEDLKLITVYTPSNFQKILVHAPDVCFNEDISILDILDERTLSDLLNKLSEAISLSMALVDINGNILLVSENYPRFCATLSKAMPNKYCEPRIKAAVLDTIALNKPDLFLCCNGIASILVPIYYGNTVIGFIKCGQIFLSQPNLDSAKDRFDQLSEHYSLDATELLNQYQMIKLAPKSRLFAAAEATFSIANCITDMTVSALRQKELNSIRLSLVKEQISKAEVEKELKDADFRLLQAQLNPHFVFNTLGTIASLAYIAEANDVAELVWNLSEILRYNLGRTEQLVPLRDEVRMVNNYLNIQLTRFKDKLKVEITYAKELDNSLVPCMILQPLIENAIIHGFEGLSKSGCIKIRIQKTQDSLFLKVTDDGKGFDPDKEQRSEGIGLKSVKNRLHYYYGDSYSFNIDSIPDKGTSIEIKIPLGGLIIEKN